MSFNEFCVSEYWVKSNRIPINQKKTNKSIKQKLTRFTTKDVEGLTPESSQDSFVTDKDNNNINTNSITDISVKADINQKPVKLINTKLPGAKLKRSYSKKAKKPAEEEQSITTTTTTTTTTTNGNTVLTEADQLPDLPQPGTIIEELEEICDTPQLGTNLAEKTVEQVVKATVKRTRSTKKNPVSKAIEEVPVSEKIQEVEEAEEVKEEVSEAAKPLKRTRSKRVTTKKNGKEDEISSVEPLPVLVEQNENLKSKKKAVC